MKIQYHYAPVTGILTKCIDGEHQPNTDWETFHKLQREFLTRRGSGEITLEETINYGHPHFHGHSGRVDIYE